MRVAVADDIMLTRQGIVRLLGDAAGPDQPGTNLEVMDLSAGGPRSSGMASPAPRTRTRSGAEANLTRRDVTAPAASREPHSGARPHDPDPTLP